MKVQIHTVGGHCHHSYRKVIDVLTATAQHEVLKITPFVVIPNVHIKLLAVTVKTRIKEQVFGGFRLILFLYIGCFLQNQPENVLMVFLKLFSLIKYSTAYTIN